MIGFNFPSLTLRIALSENTLKNLANFFEKYASVLLAVLLSVIAYLTFLIYLANGLGLAYNDARSHLDIGRRGVEGLKPGLAQLGSVWLPLPHPPIVLPTLNYFFLHTY